MKGEALRACADVLSFALTALFLSGCSVGGYVIGSAIDAHGDRTLDTANAIPPDEIQTLSPGDSIEVLFHEGGRLRCVYEKTEMQDVNEYREAFGRRLLPQPDGRQWPAPGDTVMIYLSIGRRAPAILAAYDTAEVICLGAPYQKDGLRIPVSEIDSMWPRDAGGIRGLDLRVAPRKCCPFPHERLWCARQKELTPTRWSQLRAPGAWKVLMRHAFARRSEQGWTPSSSWIS